MYRSCVDLCSDLLRVRSHIWPSTIERQVKMMKDTAQAIMALTKSVDYPLPVSI